MKGWKAKIPIARPVLANLKCPDVNSLSKTANLAFEASKDSPIDDMLAEQRVEIDDLRRALHEEREKSANMQQTIDEMKQFLDDYGLQWVGGTRPTSTDFANGPDKFVFKRKIEELNTMAEQQKMQFAKVGNISVLRSRRPLLIILQDTGFSIDNGTLRSYDKPANTAFIKDIMDGFFPQEFKDEFPDGVKMRVEDMRRGPQPGDDTKKTVELEMLPPPTDIGDGDGLVKLRIPSLPDVTIRVTSDLTVKELEALIELHFDIRQFKVCSPMSSAAFPSEKKMTEIGLYPKGMALVVFA